MNENLKQSIKARKKADQDETVADFLFIITIILILISQC